MRGEEGSGKKTGSFRGNRFNWHYLAFSRGINNIPSAPVFLSVIKSQL